ncbi:MAG: hypothetical protein GX630_04585 [Actinobacteria bacterium]|nr:hypothetical protein [Actinomycetota bacterium]
MNKSKTFWKAAEWIVTAGALLAVAIVVDEQTAGLGLVSYVVVLGVALVAMLLSRLKGALQPAPDFERMVPGCKPPGGKVEQFQTIVRQLSRSSSSESGLHAHLRPLAQEIAAARLARNHGVDLEREPEQAREVIGDGRLWELVRPDREAPEDRSARGWSQTELSLLLDELEEL